MPECENLDNCYFFIEYSESEDLNCEEFIRIYFRGPKMNECKRKEFKKQHGYPPTPDMMPDGQMIKK
jgi:hypothetical protein